MNPERSSLNRLTLGSITTNNISSYTRIAMLYNCVCSYFVRDEQGSFRQKIRQNERSKARLNEKFGEGFNFG